MSHDTALPERPAPRSLDDALVLMRDLRARCDWDRAQTHASLRPYLIEEAHEVDEAIAVGNDALLRDELGDLLLQVLFHSVVAEERGAFGAQDVAGALIAKMHARHPHLYGDGVKRSWEAMKAASAPRQSLDEGLPAGLPSLHRAHRLQDRAAGVGFDWPDARGPLLKVREELDEVAALLDDAGEVRDAEALEGELGDLLFAVVNLCRKTSVHGALALDRTNAKFTRRYAAMDTLAQSRGLVFGALSLEQQDALWDEVKRDER
ncbi:MAG: nucleoside triphosphate pyrophosphohydrolase [Gemmatimonadaceae bacterium]|nr:nucleoside triphosphate pyrophosphohydrolase [Gemmatimonadaceae bacterium]